MDCSLPNSSVDGISQARKLEWVAISSSRGYSRPRDWTHVSCVSCIGRWIPYHWATWEAYGLCNKVLTEAINCLRGLAFVFIFFWYIYIYLFIYLTCPVLGRWTWVWANFGRQWRTGQPGVLQFTGSQRLRHDLVTEQQQQQWGLSFGMQDLQLQFVGSFSVAAWRFLVGSSSLTRDWTWTPCIGRMES